MREGIVLPRGVFDLCVLPFAPDAVPAPLFQDGVASLAYMAYPCGGLGDVVSLIRSVVRLSMSFEGKYPHYPI